MLPDASQIRKTARTILKENYVAALLVSFAVITTFLIGSLIDSLVFYYATGGNATVVSLISFCLFFMPILLGTVRYFAILIEGEKVGPVEIFYYFSSFKRLKRCLGFVLSVFFRVYLSFLLITLIPNAIYVFSVEGVYKLMNVSMPVWAPVLKIAAIFLQIISIVIAAVVNMKYYLSFYIFACNDGIAVKDAISLSFRISKRTKGDFWLLLFTLTGYIIMSLTVFPLFLILPYFMLCYVVHAKCAAFSYNRSIDLPSGQYTVVAK